MPPLTPSSGGASHAPHGDVLSAATMPALEGTSPDALMPAAESAAVAASVTAPSVASTRAVSSAELQKNVSSDIYHTIVRIVVHVAEFDYELPFKIKGNVEASGTGFFIDTKGHILTCSHVVEDASHVYIEIPSEGKKQYQADVLGICPFFDLALVRIRDYANTYHCTLSPTHGDNVEPGDETYALGFPLGQDNLKVTKGIISGQQHNMYQIDTPINPGNSGGPLLKDNTVIGVNGAGVLLANNIGYAVPISRYFLIDTLLHEPKRLIHYPEIFGFEYQRTSQEFIDFLGYQCGDDVDDEQQQPVARKASTRRRRTSSRGSLTRASTRALTRASTRASTRGGGGRDGGVVAVRAQTRCRGGIYVKRTFRHSPVSRLGMAQGDIVCAVNGVAVDHYGEFDQRWMSQKMSMSNMLCTLPLNKKVTFDFWSAKKNRLLRKTFVLKEYAMPVRDRFPEFEQIDYEVIGGVVVMPLAMDHCKGMFVQGRIKKYASIEHRHEPKLVLASVLMGSYLATTRTLEKNAVLDEVNDVKVRTMDDFRKAMHTPLTHTTNGKRKRYLKFKTEERNIAILDVDVVLREEPHLQKVYKYTPSKLVATLARA